MDLPEHIRKYCCDTKERYTQQSVLPELDWPPKLGRKYIRLALIEQGQPCHDSNNYGTVIELQKDYVRGKYDKIIKRKCEIELEKIFERACDADGHELPLKVLIDGAPGVGKTTLSRNISQKWAKGEILQEYYLILLFHLRERNVKEAMEIDKLFYHDNAEVKNAMITFVKETSGRGLLIIFDGFDELSLEERQSCKDSLYLKILIGDVLSECSVVITSRPYASRPVTKLQSVKRHIEVLGFTKEQIRTCIIDDEAKAEQLCAELEDRLDIACICQIPLSCSIVLYVYKMEKYKLPDTLTELYELFILHSLKRYTTRTQSADAAERLCDLRKLPSPMKNHFDILSKLAYSSLKEDKLIFEREELEQALSLIISRDIPMLDLMTSAKSYSSRGTHDTYSFLHLTIQEYLCAFWAANNLSDKDKLDFLKENLKKERFYMILWFFAGITKLDISNVCSIFSNDLWEYDDHVHICHLLYESDNKNHSHCGYVAENCVSNKEMSLVHGGRIYSRFDCLMIAHFLAHSRCQWNRLTVPLDDVKNFHKLFNGLNLCGMSILQVVIFIHSLNIASFHEGVTGMLDEIPQFRSVTLLFRLADLSKVAVQAIKGNIKNVLIKTKAIKSICVDIVGNDKNEVTRSFYDELIEGIAHNGSPVQDIELQSVSVYSIEYLISLLIKWNPDLKLVELSISKDKSRFCREEKQCCEFVRSLSTFLSKNSSLRHVTISPPFEDNHLVIPFNSHLIKILPLKN